MNYKGKVKRQERKCAKNKEGRGIKKRKSFVAEALMVEQSP